MHHCVLYYLPAADLLLLSADTVLATDGGAGLLLNVCVLGLRFCKYPLCIESCIRELNSFKIVICVHFSANLFRELRDDVSGDW